MFDLIGSRHDPERLMAALEGFIEAWCGRQEPHHGVAAEALARVPLPEPLRRLSAFAGEWPGARHSWPARPLNSVANPTPGYLPRGLAPAPGAAPPSAGS